MGSFYVQYCWNTDPSSPTKTQWCCGHDCCNDGSPLFNASVAHQVYAPGQAVVVATVTAHALTTSTVTATSTAAPGSVAPDGMVTKQKFDLAVGLGVGLSIVSLLVFIAVLWWMKVSDWYEHYKEHKKLQRSENYRVVSQDGKQELEVSYTHDGRSGFGPHSQQTFVTTSDGQTQPNPFNQQGSQQAAYGQDAQVISPLSPGPPAELALRPQSVHEVYGDTRR